MHATDETAAGHMKTALAYLVAAQTIVALYEEMEEGPELHECAFNALRDALQAPALLAAQMQLAPDRPTVTLMELQPSSAKGGEHVQGAAGVRLN